MFPFYRFAQVIVSKTFPILVKFKPITSEPHVQCFNDCDHVCHSKTVISFRPFMYQWFLSPGLDKHPSNFVRMSNGRKKRNTIFSNENK